MRLLLWFSLPVAAIGCFRTGFDRSQLSTSLADYNTDEVEVNDKQVAKISALKPQLKFPCNIGVFLVGDPEQCRWTAEDKNRLKAFAKPLIDEGIARNVIHIPGMFAKRDSLKSMRAAAATHGCDALLVVRSASATDGYSNPLAVLDLTIVGAFVIPANHVDAMVVMQAALIDVGNGFVYASIEVDGEAKSIGPSFVLERNGAVDTAKKRALEKIGPQLLDRLRNVREHYQPVFREFGTPPGTAVIDR